MLKKFAARNKSLLLQLAQAWTGCGGQAYFLADASGEVLWPTESPAGELPTATQIVGEKPLPTGWIVAPIHAGDEAACGRAGCLGVYAPDDGVARSNLQSQAILLGQILAREEELTDMAAELMSAYDQLVAMYHVSEATRSNLELDDILRSLIDEAMRLTRAQRGFVARERDGEFHCVTCEHPLTSPPELGGIEGGREALISPLFQAVRQRRQPLICNTPSELEAALPIAPTGVERCLVAPATVDDGEARQVVAILGLLDKPTDFTAGDQKLVVALADEAGGIIERARLQAQLLAQERLRRELEIAAEIQTGLLPSILPTVPGLDVAARSQPASEVGGDFYDFVSHPAGPLTVILGDVTSKGVPAALFAAVAHTILRSASSYSPTPQALLERLSADMYDELTKAAMFVTLFIAYYAASLTDDAASLTPGRRRLVVANAGHSPVLYYDAHAGRCRLWEADGPPVGVLPEILSADQIVEPQPGDILVVMSDGFNEMANPDGEMFGIEPLMRLLEQHAGRSAAEIQATFFEVVTTFAQGAPQADDLTICVLKMTG